MYASLSDRSVLGVRSRNTADTTTEVVKKEYQQLKAKMLA